MDTLFLNAGAPGAVERAAAVLRAGGIAALPTETVYGLMGNAFDEAAVRRIFEAKGRPQDNPLIVPIAEPEEIGRVCAPPPAAFYRLAEAFWPGPLTLVLPKRPEVPDRVTAGLPSAAVRLPAHPVARAVIRAAGVPLVGPSANRSGRPSPTTAAHVKEDLAGRIDAILDGGPCAVGVESTVVSLLGDTPRILRPGHITQADIAAAAGGCEIDGAVLGELPAGVPVPSPGMKYRHYAPKAPLTLVAGAGAIDYIRVRLREADAPAGVLCLTEQAALFPEAAAVCAYGSAANPASQEAGLFAALRRLDGLGTECIWALLAPDATLAVRDRLLRACGHNVVHV